jgi:TPR repeat protein
VKLRFSELPISGAERVNSAMQNHFLLQMGNRKRLENYLDMNKVESIYNIANKQLLDSDYAGAVDNLKKILNIEKYPPALRKLGFLYANGIGINKNEDKANSLLNDAVKFGDIEAIYHLATLKYQHGKKDEAVKLHELAVRKNFLPSFYRLAWIFEKSKDKERQTYSLILFKQASQKGHVYSIGSYIRRVLRFKYGFTEIFKVPYYTILLIINTILYINYDPEFRLMK